MTFQLFNPLMRVAGILAIGLVCSASRADTATWKGGSGTYSSAGSWSGGAVPINGGGKKYDVVIDGQTTSASKVSFNSGSNVVIDSLAISAGDELDFASGNGISINYSLNNAGTMSFVGGFLSLGGDGSINTGAGTLITGGGTVLLSNTYVANAAHFSIFRASVIGSGTITRLSGVDSGTLTASGGTLTVQANGAFDNSGTTQAVGFGGIFINATTLTNEGTLALNGGSMTINASQIINNAQGKIREYGGLLYINAPYTLTRDDEFSLTAGEVTFEQTLQTAGHTFATGTSTSVEVSTLNNNGGTFDVGYQAVLTTVTNAGGLIRIHGPSESIVLNHGAIDNSGGTISTSVLLDLGDYTSFRGGTFESSGGGVLQAASVFGCALSDIVNNGTINLGTNGSVGGSFGGSGVLNFLSGSEYLNLGTVTLGGTGTATLSRSSIDAPYTSASGGSVTLVNDTSHTLIGYGSLCAGGGGTSKLVINRGLIQSTMNGSTNGTLLIGGNQFTNSTTGTLRVPANTAISLTAGDITSSGTIDIQAGGGLTVSSSAGTASLVNVNNAGTLTLVQRATSLGTVSGMGTLIANDTGTLSVKQFTASYFSSAGTVSFVDAGSNASSKTQIFAAPQVDLNTDALLIDYTGMSPLATFTTKLKSGYQSSAGTWKPTINAIYSTAAAADPLHRAIGIGELSAIYGSAVPATLLGQSVDSTTVLMRYTYLGDTNLDGKVDIADLGTLATHWQQSGPWTSGDFNYDGRIDIADLGVLAQNWQAGATSPGMSFTQALAAFDLPVVTTPEPSVLPLAGLLMLLRQKKKRTQIEEDFTD